MKRLIPLFLLCGVAIAQPPASIPTGLSGQAYQTAANAWLAYLNNLISGKEPTIAAGTSGQYWRGDKTWQALPPFAATKTPVSHQWLASYDATTGLWTQTQPAFTDISGTTTPSQLAAAVNAQTGTSYTVLDGDRGKLVTTTNVSAIAIALPQAGAAGAFLSGWFADFQNRGAGTATITPTTSTIDGAANLALTAGQGVRVFSDGTNYFTQRGVGGAGGGNPSTQPLGDNTTSAANSQFVNNQICSIAEFNPAADGTTNDSAVFTTAAASCSMIALTPGKQYAIGTNLAVSAGIRFFGATSGGPFVVKTGITLTLNGTIDAPVANLFTLQGTGSVTIGPSTIDVYPEWFGAKGDNSTDDTTAIQNAINSLTKGSVRFGSKTYKVTSVLSIPRGYISLTGNGQRNTIISSTATTGDMLTLSGVDGNCSVADEEWFNRIEKMSFKRATPATAGTGIKLTNTCGAWLSDVSLFDNFTQLLLNGGNAQTLVERLFVDYSSSSGSARSAIESDTTNNANNSVRMKEIIITGFGSNITGLYFHGPTMSDLFVTGFETALVDYGIRLVGTAAGLLTNEDIRFVQTTLDQTHIAGVLVNMNGGIGNAGAGVRSHVLFTDYYFNSGDANSIGMDIETSQGVSLVNGEMSSTGGTGVGVKMNNSQNNSISNVKFDNTPIGVWLLSSIDNKVVNNTFAAVSASPYTVGVKVDASANLNEITGNSFVGFGTNAITNTSTSHANIEWPNTIDATNITNSIVTAAGTHANVVAGPGGGSSPSVATCGTIVANSQNVVGEITSATSGTCAPVITFDKLYMGSAPNKWVCHMDNETHTGTTNQMYFTAGTTTTASFTGTTVSGDVLSYVCSAY